MTSPPQPKGAKQTKRRRPNRAEKREANRARILRAARTVFGRRGFHAATIEEIADEAGLSNGAIYYNFASKGELFFALLEQRQQDRIAHIRRTLSSPPDAKARDLALDEEAREVTRSLKDNREWRLLLLEFSAHAARDPSLAKKMRAHKRELKTSLAELFAQRFEQRGITSPLPADQLALAAAALTNGLGLEELSDPGSVPDELFGDLLATLLSPHATSPRTL
jgi:AcrR family transcriptional regulator